MAKNTGAAKRGFIYNPSTGNFELYFNGVLVAYYSDTGNNYLHIDSIDDTPVNGETEAPISSNWAFDHVAAADPHTGYMLESNIGIGDNNYLEVDGAPVDNDYAKFTANGLEGRSYSEILSDLSGQAGAAFDWNAKTLDNVQQINLTDPTELTIASGAITVTQGFHTVDTEGDAATDDLVTINGGAVGDELTLSGASDTRQIQVLRTGNIRFQPQHVIEAFNFRSQVGGSGTYYAGGYYMSPAADANLSEGGATQTYGSSNSGYGAHAFLVAGGAGSVDTGSCSIVVSGTSITNEGARTATDSETIVADITTMSQDDYYETSKRWIGQITYTLTPAGASTYSADFNYGFASYDSIDRRSSRITEVEVFGRAGANDSGFDFQVLKHATDGWTYSAAAFSPGRTAECSWVTDYVTEKNLVANERFWYDRSLNVSMDGTAGEGILFKIITSANNAVEFMDINLYAEAIPNDYRINNTNHVVKMIYNGTNWMVH